MNFIKRHGLDDNYGGSKFTVKTFHGLLPIIAKSMFRAVPEIRVVCASKKKTTFYTCYCIINAKLPTIQCLVKCNTVEPPNKGHTRGQSFWPL